MELVRNPNFGSPIGEAHVMSCALCTGCSPLPIICRGETRIIVTDNL
jgi:hypothetical protein